MEPTTIKVDLEQGTPAWHTWRNKHVNASETSVFFDVNPYKTVRDYFFEKSGLVELEDEPKWIYSKGHEAEAELRQLFSKHIKTTIRPACFEKGIFGASLDGYEPKVGAFESKLVGEAVLKGIVGGDIPEHHRIQVQTQLYVADLDKAYYGVKTPKMKGGHVTEMGRDEKLIKEIVKRGEAFWESLISGKIPQLSPRDTLFITKPAEVALFEKLKALKAKKDALEAEYDEIDKRVRELASHPKVRCGEVTVTEAERQGAIDYLKIPEVKALAQEYLERFRKQASKYKTIRFGKGA